MSSYPNRVTMLKGHTGASFAAKELITVAETKEHDPVDVEATRSKARFIGNVDQDDSVDTSDDVMQDLSRPTEPTVSHSFDEMSRFQTLMGL
jgi:hypothetical protein